MDKIDHIFTDIEDLLQASIKVEHLKAVHSSTEDDKAKHRYAERLCKTVLEDFKKLERKHTR